MKLLTYNVHHWEGMDGRVDVGRITTVIRASGVDLVALNEVYHPAPGLDRQIPGPALTAMADALGMEAAFAPALAAAPFGPTGVGLPYGNALLSRWPILAHAGHHLPAVEAGHEVRGLLEARVLLPDDTSFTVYVTHLDHRSEAIRLVQVQALLTWVVRDRARPHVLLGDLNTHNPSDYPTPQAWEALRLQVMADGYLLEDPLAVPRLLKAGYYDAYAVAGQGPRETHSTVKPWGRIDYCLVSQPLAQALVTCQRWDDPLARQASDHFPVLAEISYP